MSENWTLAVNTRPNLRLQLEQMLNPYPSEPEYASSPPESLADSTGDDGLTQFEGGQDESELLGEENDESDGEADPNWPVQMTGIENDAQEDQRSQAQSSSDVPEDPRALALRACANLNVRVEFTEECCKRQSSWNAEMQTNAENHRSRLAEVEKKLTESETILTELMSRVTIMERTRDDCGESTGKAAPKRVGKQATVKRRAA